MRMGDAVDTTSAMVKLSWHQESVLAVVRPGVRSVVATETMSVM